MKSIQKLFFWRVMEEIKTKVCSNPDCEHGGEHQPITNFYKKLDKYTSQCKDCINKKQHKYNITHREEKKKYNQKYYNDNKDNIQKQHHEYYLENRDHTIEHVKLYYQNNIDEIKEQKHNHYIKNKDKIIDDSRKYYQEHRCEKLAYQEQYYLNHINELKVYKTLYNNSPAKFDLFYEKLKVYNECRQDPSNPDLLQVKCHRSECPEWFNPTALQVINRLHALNADNTRTHGESNLYCSDKCKELCPAFNQRIRLKTDKSNKDYSRDDQPELRELVLARDNYTCQREECGKSLAEYPDLKLICHHIFPLNEDPVGSADVDNCITVCVDCHKWIHTHIPGCSTAELRCSK